MKKLTLMLALNIAFLNFAIGQILAFKNAHIAYEEEQVQSVEVILKPEVELLEDKLNAWLKENHDVKLDHKKFIFFDKEYLTANEVIIPKISDRKIDLKVKVQSTPNDKTRLNLFASFGYNNWITDSDYPEEFVALEDLTYTFVKKYLPEYYNQKIENKENQITNIKLENDDILGTINSNKEEMANLEKTNKELLKDWKENKNKLQKLKVKLGQLEYEYEHVVNKTN